MASGTTPQDNDSEKPRLPRLPAGDAARVGYGTSLFDQVQTPVCAELLLRNVPNVPGQGPLGGEYLTGTAQGGVIYPSTWNGVDPGPEPLFSVEEDGEEEEDNGGATGVAATPEVSATYGDAYLQLLESFQVQLSIGYAASSGPPAIPRRTRPTAYQSYPVQLAYVARSPHPSDDPHRQDPVASPQHQGSAFVRDALGRPYYQQWTSNHTISSSPASTVLQLPVQPQRFNLTDEQCLPLQISEPQSYFGGKGKRRALIIGINYTFHPDPSFRLWYCIEDAYVVANYLYQNQGFAREDIHIMTDGNSPWDTPTKENILREMSALVHDAQPHDSFFIYFSGHAVQVLDLDGFGSDELDECICATDYLDNDPNPNPDPHGLIADDIMHEIMVRSLPTGCCLMAIFDVSCNSGTLLDLPYLYNAHGVVEEFRHPNRLEAVRRKSSYAHVLSLGATNDRREALKMNRGGALRRAFIECMTVFRNNPTYRQLIQYLREDMISQGIPQRPLLSSSHEIDIDTPFTIPPLAIPEEQTLIISTG